MVRNRFVLLLLILAFALGTVGCSAKEPVQAEHTAPISKTEAMMEITNAYVTECLGLTDASVTLGNRLCAYSLSGGKLEPIAYEKYPVFADSVVVAFTTCFQSETGEYLPGCGAKFAEAFWKVYSEQPGAAIALVYAREGAWLVREGEDPVLLHKMPLEDRDPIQNLEKCRASLVYAAIS